MFRRNFIKGSTLLGAAALTGATNRHGALAQAVEGEWPTRFIMAGHAQPTTSFSRGLELIGARLVDRFDERIEPRFVFNIEEVGFDGSDLLWLVDARLLTLAYSTDLSDGVPALEVAALPFLFSSTVVARAAMDGEIGFAAIEAIESRSDLRVLGFFENGFRHLSNDVRPVRTPADLDGLRVRVFPVVQAAFRMLGADVRYAPISQTIPMLADGTFDGQENPFENVVGYGLHLHQRYYTATYHAYMSRPIFIHRPTFDAWPEELQTEVRQAVTEAVRVQREIHDRAEIDSAAAIREAGGEIVELSAEQRDEFVAAVEPIYADARSRYDRDLLALVGM